MPYIASEQRPPIDAYLNPLIAWLVQAKEEVRDGEVNYVITRILKDVYPVRYRHLNAAIGVLECAKQELYRRVAIPYEDAKIMENGDV